MANRPQQHRLSWPLTPGQVQSIDEMLQTLFKAMRLPTSLASTIVGILPIANGGTNSGTALSGRSLMMSNGSAIVQSDLLTDAAGDDIILPGIAAPATPAAGFSTLYAATANGHTALHSIDQDGSDLILLRDNFILVRNTSGGSLTKGTVVDVFGATGQVPNVRVADNTIALRHGEAILQETIANNGFGLAITLGYVARIDTSAWVDGTVLYTGTAGALTSTLPTIPPAVFQQHAGVVIYSHATQGIILVNFQTIGVSTSSGSVADYVVASDGAIAAPAPLNDGAGSFIYVSYTP